MSEPPQGQWRLLYIVCCNTGGVRVCMCVCVREREKEGVGVGE